jgi:hypothetical protein
MLTIRAAQMAALTAPHRERFVDRTLATLAGLFPGDPRLADETAIRAEIRAGVARAESYDITRDREVGLFVVLVHALGLGFEERPDRRWIAAILRDANLEEQAKLDLIFTRLHLAERGQPG